MIKKHINTLCGGLLLFFSGINFVIYLLDYQYRPRSYVFFFVCLLLCLISMVFLSIKHKKNALKTARIFAYVMPVIAVVYSISLPFGFDFCVDNTSYDLLCFEAIFFLVLSASVIILLVYCSKLLIRLLVFCGSICFSVFFGYVVLVSLFGAMMANNSIVQSVNSPEDTYVAYLVSSDQGALGGSTEVIARNIKKDIPLLSGHLIKERVALWNGHWGYNPYLEWENDSVVLIDGKEYDVKKLLQ